MRRYLTAILIGLLIFLSYLPVSADTAMYIYDELGRLKAVIDDSGNKVIYNYDAVGNLISITKEGVTGPVAIIELDPWEGEVGTRVTIYGMGFSSVLSENQVSFNGISSLVEASTPTTIITSVPSGATSGPVTVTTPLGTVTTSRDFIVTTPIGITITPSKTILWPGYDQQFTAEMTGTAETGVIWSVNDVQGGNSSVGTITETGFYTPPSSIANLSSVTIKARSVKDPSKYAEAQVYFLESKPPIISNSVSVVIAYPVSENRGPFMSSSVSVSIEKSGVTDTGPFLANPVSVEIEIASIPENKGPFISSSISVAIAESGVIDRGPFISSPVSINISSPITQSGPFLSSSVSVGITSTPENRGPFTSSSVSVSLNPIITSITPDTGIQGNSNLTLTIAGKGFSGATGLNFNLDGVNDSNITVNSLSVNIEGTQVTSIISIAPTATVGRRVVTIITPTGTSPMYFMKGNIFNINAP